MKYLIVALFVSAFLLSSQRICAQTLQNDVIASAGDVSRINNLEITWMMGEIFTESYQTGNVCVSQGFHQPIFNFSEILQPEKPQFHVDVFPNPTSKLIHIEVTGSSKVENFRFVLSDLMGNVLINQDFDSLKNNLFDLSEYSGGILILKIIRVSDGMYRTYKVVRTGY
jgi:hypothetical protein